MKANPSHPYTLASRMSQSANQNLPKSMAAPPHGQTADRKHGHTTSCIVHLADSANFKGVTPNKLCNGLTGLCFKSPNDTIHVTVVAKLRKPEISIFNRKYFEFVNSVSIFGN